MEQDEATNAEPIADGGPNLIHRSLAVDAARPRTATGQRLVRAASQRPLFWLPQEVVANSGIVGEYPFPGNVTGIWTHLEYIKAGRQ